MRCSPGRRVPLSPSPLRHQSPTYPPGATAADFVLLCRPILWEADNIPLTWQSQLSSQDLDTILEPSNGGKQLRVFQPAIYKCFVQQELMARFNPVPFPGTAETLREKEGGPHRGKGKTQEGKASSILKGLKLLLLLGTVLGLLGVLLKIFHPSQGKSSDQVLLVK